MIHNKLFNILEAYVKGTSVLEEFLKNYESVFLDEQDSISLEVGDALFSRYDDIFMFIERYEPNIALREESPNYIGEEELKVEVSKIYHELVSYHSQH